MLRSVINFANSARFNRLTRLPQRRLFSAAGSVPTHEEQYQEQQKRNEEAGVLTELVRDFLDPSSFYKAIQAVGIDFFTGVPDSLLKDFCAYVADNAPASKHVITCNEGAAIALASGYHLATGKASLVYMQNSGLGNAVNPLVSLCAPEVYSIPMLLLIGWRGEPGKRDEPQHLVQGQITPGLLAALGIPFQPLPDYIEGAEQALYTAQKHLERTKAPYALLVKRQTFTPYKMKTQGSPEATMTREQATEVIISCSNEKDVVIGTTGMLSRELFELRDKRKEGHEKDFLTVGCMGHASSIALGIATQRKDRRIICIDGDGAVLMHMGNLATVAQIAPKNFLHIVLNNGAHDSVGGQPTAAAAASKCSLTGAADAVGYVRTFQARTPEQVVSFMEEAKACNGGPVMLEVKIKCGSRKDLGRPTRTPIQNKADFMHFLAINS